MIRSIGNYLLLTNSQNKNTICNTELDDEYIYDITDIKCTEIYKSICEKLNNIKYENIYLLQQQFDDITYKLTTYPELFANDNMKRQQINLKSKIDLLIIKYKNIATFLNLCNKDQYNLNTHAKIIQPVEAHAEIIQPVFQVCQPIEKLNIDET